MKILYKHKYSFYFFVVLLFSGTLFAFAAPFISSIVMVFLLALIAFVTHLTLSILNERQDLTTTILRQELDETYLKLAKTKTNLLHSEENIRKYTRIIEQSPMSVIITNLKGMIEFVNPRFTELTGYSFDEAIGENPRILKSGDMPPDEYKNLWDTIANGEVWRGVFHNKRKDGSLYWEYAHIAPVKTKSGKITHYIAVKEDITKKKEIDDAHRMYSSALHSISDSVLISDLNKKILYANNAFLNISEYTQEEIYGQSIDVFFPNEHDKSLIETIFKGKQAQSWHGEIPFKTKNGRIFYMLLSTSVIENTKNNPFAIVSVGYDLTREKNAQEITRKAEMLKTVQELAGAVSHEFAQPLQVLSNYIGLIQMGEYKPEFLDKSKKAVQQITELVANLSEITSIKKQDYLNAEIINLKASSKREVNNKRILIVDDETEILSTIHEIMSLSGYQSDMASSGMDAIKLINQNDYALILSDINMPRMNGTQLFEKLKILGYDGAFIFLTGYNLPEGTEHLMDKVDGLIHKPVDLKKLLDIVKGILEKKPREIEA